MENWRLINGYPNYLVSDFGRVMNSKKAKILCQGKVGRLDCQYNSVCLSRDGHSKTFHVHKLVADAFLQNPLNKPCVDHINGDRENNRLDNLRWVTHQENQWNRKVSTFNKTSRFKGVSLAGRKYLVHISVGGRVVHVGLFENEEDAARAYNARAAVAFGEYAKLNVL